MTIAMQEPVSVADHAGDWAVVCCLFRNEYHLVHDLTHIHGIPSFWPRVEYIRPAKGSDGRVRRNLERRSLFPGYVSFCLANQKQRDLLMDHSDVETILTSMVQSKFVREIALIEAALKENPKMVTYAVSAVGERCKIKSGPFMGMEGKLIDIRGEQKFVVEIETFGRMVPLEIDPMDLEAA